MKKLLSVLSLMVLSVMLYAQTPQSFSYQTVIRDAGWNVLANQSVGIEISILEDVINGTSVYKEEHSSTTSTIGLVNLAVGEGTVVNGDFTTIDWGNHSYFIQVALDVTGGNNYQVMGTTQLRSVPYALYAETAGNPGPQGIPGDTGAVGPQGPIGLTGPQGIPGDTGAVGPQGIPGDTGAVGSQGFIGLTGPQGIPGDTGSVGPQGLIGLTGPQGIPGDTGAVGPQGAASTVPGPQGATGPQGPVGPQGPAGSSGSSIATLGDGMPTMVSQESTAFSLDLAMIYCSDLVESGFNDWILPSVDQLTYAASGGAVIPGNRTNNELWTRKPAGGTSSGHKNEVHVVNLAPNYNSQGVIVYIYSSKVTTRKCRCVR